MTLFLELPKAIGLWLLWLKIEHFGRIENEWATDGG